MTGLEVLQMTCCYGVRRVLDTVSISVGNGELVGLIGPNGSGKSTLLKSVLGLLPATGSIHCDGRDTSKMSSEERAALLSYLPQERDIAWPVSVETLVRLGCIQARDAFTVSGSNCQASVEKAMRRANVTHLRRRLVDTLSGGERARVLIARVLAQDAPIVLADEPIAGLDPAHQIGCMELLDDLTKNGRSVVVSMHDLPLAARWCHRLVLLDNGKVAADGAPGAVLTPDNLAKVYNITAYISEASDGLIVLPASRLQKNNAPQA